MDRRSTEHNITKGAKIRNSYSPPATDLKHRSCHVFCSGKIVQTPSALSLTSNTDQLCITKEKKYPFTLIWLKENKRQGGDRIYFRLYVAVNKLHNKYLVYDSQIWKVWLAGLGSMCGLRKFKRTHRVLFVWSNNVRYLNLLTQGHVAIAERAWAEDGSSLWYVLIQLFTTGVG